MFFQMEDTEMNADNSDDYYVKQEDYYGNNPWSVQDATAFLKYCCPECDFQILNYNKFSDHATRNHPR